MAKSATGGTVDAEVVRELARLLEETGLTEIELGRDGWHVRVAKTQTPVHYAAAPAAQHAAAEPVVAPVLSAQPAEHPGAILSPMVGIVYSAAEEGAQPFVKVGDTVTAGQTLLLIEAMKVFNTICAPTDGRVAAILVANGAPVEYGEPLMIIE